MNIYNEAGLYIISDSFFERFKDYNLIQNKKESRPYYYAIRGKDGLLWMIPLTSKVEKTKERIATDEMKRGKGNCIFYHVGIVSGQERGFKIGNMFPVTEDYILRNYTVNGIAYFVGDKKLKTEIRTRARRYLNLVNSGTIKPSVDILSIQQKLLAND